ncbi:MAG: hypothetical protein SGI97_04640 [candidate division Zixibacteria bacterium]|nr:hypothetical protein [candidate division Zixibacteria bacterium]
MKRIAALVLLGALMFCNATKADSVDSSRSPLPPVYDTIDVADTLDVKDSLGTERDRLKDFEARIRVRQQLEKEREPRPKPFFYFDSLSAYLLSPRLDNGSAVRRFFTRDAGDYFRTHPGFFSLAHQTTPMRTTVQPFGLQGDRMNYLMAGQQYRPFEHIIEPDGLVDLNDLPTTLDESIYVLPAGAGAVFGGDGNGVATLLTIPIKRDTASPHTAFIVDKGFYSYSNVRGRYANNFSNGRKLTASLGYKTADGLVVNRQHDSYTYTADLYQPLTGRYALKVAGSLNDAEGPLPLYPDIGGSSIQRKRFDRSLRVAFLAHTNNFTATNSFGYSHLRQGSNIDGPYKGRFNITGHSLETGREWLKGNKAFSSDVELHSNQYDDGFERFDRYHGELSFGFVTLTKPSNYAVRFSARAVEGVGLLPSVSAVWQKESENLFFMFSALYQEREPTLHELHLRHQRSLVYPSSFGIYSDIGNPNLEQERQLVGSADVGWGNVARSLCLSVAGGKIFDGIDWRYRNSIDETTFFPMNGNVTFLNVTARGKLQWKDVVTASAGASHYTVDYDAFADRAYTPDFHFFSNLELHWFWKAKLIHLYGYGEFIFLGPYEGYQGRFLGEIPLLNVSLSFQLNTFRFHYVIQNLLSNSYEPREYFEDVGRFNSYGFIWNFFD